MALNAELTLQDYWRIIRRRKGIFFLTWFLVLSATFIFTEMQTPIYKAEAVVKIEQSPSIQGLGGMNQFDTWSLMNTEVKSIRSTSVSKKTALALGWITDETSEENALRIAKSVQAQIQSDRLGESNLIRVSVYSDNPKKAATMANAVVQAYIEKGIEDRTLKARETKEFTFQELVKAEKKLRNAEDALKDFSETKGARNLANYLSGQLVTMQTKLDDLLKNYTDKHPQVKETKAKIAAVESQLRRLPSEETEQQRLVREVRINEELYTFLAKKHKEAQISESEREQTAFIDSPALVPQAPVRPNKKLNMAIGLFIGMILGFVVVLLAENLDTSIGTIEDVEHYLELPVLAVVPHIDTSSGGKEGRPPLISFKFPRTPTMTDMRQRLAFYHPAKSSFVEAYHTLRTNLQLPLKPGKRPGPVIGFTSAGVSEGKTLTGMNFALTSAQSGLKTLFIEGDLRRPSAHKLLGISREPGLTDSVLEQRNWVDVVQGTSDFLLGDIELEHILRTPGIENFRLLSCGPSPLNPADILGSTAMSEILKQARTMYDLIIIDCAPVMLFADALLVGPQTDGLILVYKAGRTARGALKRAKDQLVNVKTKMLGVVLNDLRSAEMEPHYGYYYYSYKYEPTESGSSKG